MGQPKNTQKTIWQYLMEDEKRKKELFSLVGTALVVVTFFFNFDFRDSYKEKAASIEAAIARRDVLEAIDRIEKEVGEGFERQRELMTPRDTHAREEYISYLRGRVQNLDGFLTKVEKELSDFENESWSYEMHSKVDNLRAQEKGFYDELGKPGNDPKQTRDKIDQFQHEVSHIYGDFTGKRISLRDTAQINYEVSNWVSVGFFMLAIYLKLWSHGMTDDTSAASGAA